MTIFKMQRPVYGTEPSMPWLIYSRGHEHYSMIPNAEIDAKVRAMMGSDLKMYVEGKINDGKLVIECRVGDEQDW